MLAACLHIIDLFIIVSHLFVSIHRELETKKESLAPRCETFICSIFKEDFSKYLTLIYNAICKYYISECSHLYWPWLPDVQMEPGPQQMVIHFVQFLISEMKLPQDKIVEFAECNEVFPSPSLEKVDIYQVNIVDSFYINNQ